jgi:signal transduction histidine kinase
VIYANQKTESLFGPFDDQPCWQTIQGQQTGPCGFCSNPYLITPQGEPAGVYRWEYQNARNGRYYTVIDNAIRWEDGRLVRLSIAIDSTEMKRAQGVVLEQQQEFATIKERQRLARDLHDSMTQSLDSLVLSIDSAAYFLQDERYEMLSTALEMLDTAARQARQEMRLLLFEMTLVPETEIDLREMLNTRLNTVEKRIGIEVSLSIEGIEKLPIEWEVELFYIAMEALNNTLKHAQASRVTISIQATPYQLALEISDDGCGFTPDEHLDHGMGLGNMMARAASLGGEMTFDSAPGEGTRVKLIVER